MSGHTRYDSILVPTDGSAAARTAVEHAISIAAANEADIQAVYVIDERVTMAATDQTRPELTDTLRTEGENALATVEDVAAAADVSTTTHIQSGTPAKEILDFADAANSDLIVMGNSGRTAREKLIRMGSVSERVADNATIPVLVVPYDKESS